MNTENNYVETDLGNISPNPCGEYNQSMQYEYLDLVNYQGGSYLCTVELENKITGIAPVQGKNTEYWQLVTLPGDLTPEYIAMHDDVANKAKQVEASTAAAELAQQEAESALTDVEQLHSDTVNSANKAAESRDSAAGYAQTAETAREKAKESEENVNAQVTDFDTHVAEKTQEVEQAIADARQQAVQTVAKQGELSVQTVKNETAEYIEEQKNTAKEEISSRADEIVSELKEDIKDIITKTPTEEKTDVEATEIINRSIILSSGNLSTNQYTTRYVVNRYDNVKRGKYEAHGYAQGNQCLYVVKKSDEVKAYQKVGDTIDVAGTKTLDLTIEEDGCTVYVGAYENIVGWLKKYGEKKTLNNNIEVPQIDIAKITKSNLYEKKVTLNGDSIAFGAGTGGTGFIDYIASKYNMTLDKKAVSGATIANLSSRYPDKHCICTSIDTMAEDANYIIFEGGYNDWLLWTQIGTLTDTMSGDLDDTKFYGALESICRQALAKWENGKIGFIITHKINDAWRTQKQEGATYPTLDGYYQAIKNVCEKYSIPYLDLSKVSRLNTELQNYKKYTYNSDGVHPTKDGYQIFYVDTIARWMENL